MARAIRTSMDQCVAHSNYHRSQLISASMIWIEHADNSTHD